jgi:small subunit ribosomal protein S1
LLEEEENKVSNAVRANLKEGVEVEGTVTRLKSFGAFVDIGGNLEGLVHVSELSHKRVEHPREVLRKGQEVRVVVVRLKDLGDKRRERISLSLKALEKDPWDEISRQFPPGSVVKGKVDSVESYGAFVEMAPEVRGMVHVSELAEKRVAHPGDVVSVGDEVTVTVLALDHRRRRLSLSIKQVEKFEADSNLKEFQKNQKKAGEESQGVNAMVDALQRAKLIS